MHISKHCICTGCIGLHNETLPAAQCKLYPADRHAVSVADLHTLHVCCAGQASSLIAEHVEAAGRATGIVFGGLAEAAKGVFGSLLGPVEKEFVPGDRTAATHSGECCVCAFAYTRDSVTFQIWLI